MDSRPERCALTASRKSVHPSKPTVSDESWPALASCQFRLFALTLFFQTLARCLVCGFILLAGTTLVQADGKVFGRPVQVKVEIPDQRALLHYSNGVERLVIDTAFVGEGDHFAWVVPMPSRPVIEPVSNRVFSKLDAAFQPEIIDRIPEHWTVVLILGGLLVLGKMSICG